MRFKKINKQKTRKWGRDEDIAFRVRGNRFESEFKHLGEFT